MDKIVKGECETILLCQDMRIAFILNNCIRNSNRIVISSYFGNNIDKLPWSYISSKKIIIIHAPTLYAVKLINSYIGKLYFDDNEILIYKNS